MNRKRVAAAALLSTALGLALWLGLRNEDPGSAPPQDAEAATAPGEERRPAALPSPSPMPRASTAAAPLAPDEEGLDAFLRSRHPGPWTRQRFDGQPVHRTSVHGGLIAGAGADRESAATLARSISRYLGVDPLLIHPDPARMDAGPRSITYEYQQWMQGYEVFDGRMTVLARSSDGAVYMVNSDLRVPDPVETQPRVTIEEARRIVGERYSERDAEIASSSNSPVIWADSKPHELAWRFSVEMPAPNPDRLEVLVGASSGRIVLERSTLMH